VRGFFDNAEELLLRRSRADGHAVEKLDHETSKALECSWNTNSRVYLDEDTLGGVNIYLEFASLVDRRIEQGEETLS